MTETQHAPFHFSPRSNRAHEIQWREWGPAAFQEAQESGKPVLLSLSAVWCHWCHVMDETSYSDPGVISYINERYIPVRVDNDQRPDINARYNMGGWPTTALLTPDGEVLAGGTYVPPDQMRDLLPKVAIYYTSNKEEVARKVEEVRQRRAAASAGARGGLSAAIFEAVLRSVTEAYDPVFGGFGEAPKFPHTDVIDLLLYGYRGSRDPDLLHMARKTLEFMSRGGVFDQEWGGFFRYATGRDWSEPHYEKMLEDNANLLRDLLALYRASGEQAHADTAARVIAYMEDKLRDKAAGQTPARLGGFFYGSQDADEEFYKLPAAEREKHPEPYIDRTCYTSWNAMAASALLEASWTLARPDHADAALAVLDFAWEHCRQPDRGMYRFNDGTPQVLGLLGDQAYMARALLDAQEVSGDSVYLERALELAGVMTDRFIDEDGGGFFDTWDQNDAPGRLRERQKSVQDNAVCAEVFIRLHHLTRTERYGHVAQGTLGSFVEAYPLLGYLAAAYGRQVDTFLNPPVEVNIVGGAAQEATRALQSVALALDVPSRVVQVLDPQRDGARLEALFLPAEPAPAAYVCAGTMCSAPVSAPERLAETVRDMQKAGQPS